MRMRDLKVSTSGTMIMSGIEAERMLDSVSVVVRQAEDIATKHAGPISIPPDYRPTDVSSQGGKDHLELHELCGPGSLGKMTPAQADDRPSNEPNFVMTIHRIAYVVPTKDRAADLRKLLISLGKQTVAPAQM